MTDEQLQQIQRLREQGSPPKIIARQLGLRPADVSEAVRQLAIAQEEDRIARGELPPLHECLIDEVAARWLLDGDREFRQGPEGLSHVVVCREDRGRLKAGTFLIDYWCLGIKNAIPPRRLDAQGYERYRDQVFLAHGSRYRAISLEQAQAVVFGAIDYAAALGFEPHPDAQEALPLLGPRPTTLLALEFGENGKPHFINGPHDDYQAILRQLDERLGAGNYETTILLGSPDDPLLEDLNLEPSRPRGLLSRWRR